MKFFFLIFIESYVANLASFLTVSGASGQTSLDDLLKKGILSQDNGNVDFAQASGGKIVTTTASPTPELLKEMMANGNPKNVMSYVMGSGVLLNSVDQNCDTRFISLGYTVDTSLSFREHATVATVRRAVDYMTLLLRQNGTLLNMVDQTYINESLRCPDSRFPATERVQDSGTLQLDVDNMTGLFTITLALMCVAVIVAIILRVAAQFMYGAYSSQQIWEESRGFMKDIHEAPSGVELRKDPDSWKSKRIRDRERKMK